MDLQFDALTVILFVALAFVLGYAGGAIRASAGSPTLPSPPLRPLTRIERDEVVALIAEGEAIDTIRRLRELTGADLRQAHQAVKQLERDRAGRALKS